jgi:hypothetical protein
MERKERREGAGDDRKDEAGGQGVQWRKGGSILLIWKENM